MKVISSILLLLILSGVAVFAAPLTDEGKQTVCLNYAKTASTVMSLRQSNLCTKEEAMLLLDLNKDNPLYSLFVTSVRKAYCYPLESTEFAKEIVIMEFEIDAMHSCLEHL